MATFASVVFVGAVLDRTHGPPFFSPSFLVKFGRFFWEFLFQTFFPNKANLRVFQNLLHTRNLT